MKKKELFLFFASSVLTVLLVIGLGELGLRIRYPSGILPKELGGGYPAHMVLPEPKTGYTLRPGFRGKQLVPGRPDVDIRINSQGLRDHERQLLSSAEAVVVLGDSFAFGHGVAFEKIWPVLLEKKIQESRSEVYVVKAGVPGFNWRQYFQQYQRLVLELPRQRLVIMAFTVDAGARILNGYEVVGGILVKGKHPDLMVLEGLVYEKPSHSEWINQIDAWMRSRTYFFRFFNQRVVFLYHRLKRLVRQLREGSSSQKTVHRAPPPLPKQRHIRHALMIFDSISELAKTQGANVLVLFISNPHVWSEEIAFYEKALAEKGIPTLDLSKYEAASGTDWRLPHDGHWNELGNRDVARIVYEFIQEKKLLESVN